MVGCSGGGYLHVVAGAALVGAWRGERGHVHEARGRVLGESRRLRLRRVVVRRMLMRVRVRVRRWRWRTEPLRLDLERAEQRRGALLEQLVRLQLDVRGAQRRQHVRVLGVDVPDGGGDVLPEGRPQVRIVAGAGAAVEQVHVGGRALLLAQQRL